MVFPDEDYDFKELKKDHFFVGAYNDDGTCIGLAIYCKDWFRYLYLDDLKVSKQYRSQGVGRLLLEEGKKIASENGYRGIYTIGQDNNLSACQFYLHNHFEIGGFNTNVYRGTSQENKNDIYFYPDSWLFRWFILEKTATSCKHDVAAFLFSYLTVQITEHRLQLFSV